MSNTEHKMREDLLPVRWDGLPPEETPHYSPLGTALYFFKENGIGVERFEVILDVPSTVFLDDFLNSDFSNRTNKWSEILNSTKENEEESYSFILDVYQTTRDFFSILLRDTLLSREDSCLFNVFQKQIGDLIRDVENFFLERVKQALLASDVYSIAGFSRINSKILAIVPEICLNAMQDKAYECAQKDDFETYFNEDADLCVRRSTEGKDTYFH